MKKESSNRIIKKWQLLTLSGGLSLLLVLGALVYYSYEKQTIKHDKQQEIKAIAGMKISQIQQWRNDKIAEVGLVAQSVVIVNAVKAWLDNPRNQSLKNEIVKQLMLFSSNEKFGFSNIYFTSTNGECYFSAKPGEDVLNPLTEAAVYQTTKSGEFTFTDFYYCTIHHAIHYDIISPIFGEKNRPVAALVFRINPNHFLYPLIQSWPTPSKTSETLLVEKDGDSILYLNDLRHVRHSALHLHEALSSKEIPGVKAVLGYTGIFEGKDYRGVDVLAYLEPVAGTPWFMVAKVDKSEIFSELYYRAVFIILFTIVLILLTGASLVMIYRSRQKNLYQHMLAAEKELGAMQEEFKTTLYSIGDGVITTDIEGRVMQLNPVAENLTGWSELEAAGKPLQDIFRIINEDSRIMVANPVEKVLKEGLIVGLANHTLLVAKDGTETPIADSGAPIKNKAGVITGVVMVFRDQTEERQATRKLLQSEATILNKLKAITEPEGDIGSLELSDIIDIEVMQPVLEDFFRLTGMLGAILDISGKVLVAVGWQDICTKFHRCNAETLKNCIESDTILTKGIPQGEYKTYHCKNNMWDMATPLIIGDRHVGNIFIGQFFYSDEKPDVELFRNQAKRYGFNEDEYLSALQRVPHFDKENVEAVMHFYARLTGIISRLSYSSIQQSRLIAQRNLALEELQASKEEAERLLQLTEKSSQVLLSLVEDEKKTRLELKNLNEELEQKIAERTRDLSEKNSELLRMNRLFVDRELRMVELKKRIKELEGMG